MESSTVRPDKEFAGGCHPLGLPAAPGSKWKTVDFQIESQAKTNWCWAAVAVSVAKFYDKSFRGSQCDVANGELRRKDCCETSRDDPCNVFGFLMSSLHRVGHFRQWHVRKPRKAEALQAQIRRDVQAEIVREIDAGRPLCARIVWAGGGGHFIAISGYAHEAGTWGVAVADPWWGVSDVDWDDFPARYRTGAIYTDSYHTSGS